MSQANNYVALDIGSSTIKVLIGEMDQNSLHVIGVGNVQSAGIRKGTIIDIDATVQSIRKAIEQAERMTGLKIEEVVLGIPANGVQFQNVKGVVAVNSENREITDDDLERVMKSSQVMNVPPEREFVNLVPKQFIVDDYDEITDPRGMMGVRLEMDATLITTSKTQLHNILRCVERAGLQIREIYLQPLAAGTFALSEDEMYHGTAFIDIGGGSTTVSVFAENRLISTSVIPVGGDHLTKDLSIVLKTSNDQARMIKHQHGHAYYEEASDDDLFEVPVVGSDAKDQYSQRYIAEVIGSRLEELFELVLEDLYATGIRDLPGGIVLTGGTAKLEGIQQLAREVFKTRVRLYTPENIGVREPMYSTAVGLIRYAYMEDVFYGFDGSTTLQQQTNEPVYEAAERPVKPAAPKKEKGGFMKKAKKMFDNFFE